MLDPPSISSTRDPVYQPFWSILVIAGLFGLAWLVARSSKVALRVPARHGRGTGDGDLEATGKMVNVKRGDARLDHQGCDHLPRLRSRDHPSIGQLIGGLDRLTAIAGASFLIIVAGRRPEDPRGHHRRPDHVRRALVLGRRHRRRARGVELQGVIEDVSLRHTRLRSVTGEVIHIHNSQIQAVRVLPRGRQGARDRGSS